MRRIMAVFLSVLLALSLAACGNNNQNTVENTLAGTTAAVTEAGMSEQPSASADDSGGDIPEVVGETGTDGPAPETEETETETETEPPAPWTWPVDTPENQGFRSEALPQIHEVYDSFPLLSAMIVKNGYVIDTYYKDGYDADSVFVLNSASKSVTSALFGIAVELGYFDGTDDLLSDYLPQVAEQEDARWQNITLWNLLTHTSGIATTDDALWGEWRGSENWMQYIFALPMTSDPGTHFDYSTGNTHLLAAAIEAATGMTLYDFGQEYLFGPMQMDSVRIDIDPQGNADGGNGIWMTTADMAKIGQLYLNNGVWEGEQLIPSEWIAQSTSSQFVPGGGRADYGYQWWVRTFGTAGHAAYFAQGHAGQYIIVVPDLSLVIAFNSDYEGATSIYWQLVNSIVDACAG